MRPSIFRPAHFLRRPYSTTPPTPSSVRTRLTRVLDRTPRFLHPYTNALRTAPISHLISFLILHEITAIVPLVGLSAAFHYSQWTPEFMQGEAMEAYQEKFQKYFKKKGWFGVGEEGEGEVNGNGRGGMRVVLEVATAYAVTKALLPIRIIGSVWATPWFARVVVGRFKSLARMGR